MWPAAACSGLAPHRASRPSREQGCIEGNARYTGAEVSGPQPLATLTKRLGVIIGRHAAAVARGAAGPGHRSGAMCHTDLAVVKAVISSVPNARGKHNLVFDSFVPWANRQTAQLRYGIHAEVHAGMLRPSADECGRASRWSRASVPPGGDASRSFQEHVRVSLFRRARHQQYRGR